MYLTSFKGNLYLDTILKYITKTKKAFYPISYAKNEDDCITKSHLLFAKDDFALKPDNAYDAKYSTGDK